MAVVVPRHPYPHRLDDAEHGAPSGVQLTMATKTFWKLSSRRSRRVHRAITKLLVRVAGVSPEIHAQWNQRGKAERSLVFS